MTPRLTLIDGNSILFRAYYGVHSRLIRNDGTPVNAVFGFCNMLLPLLSKAGKDDMFICVFDAQRINWRNDIYPEYKANRQKPPEDLAAQFQLARDAAAAFGMPVLSIKNVEADDVIATLAMHECAIGRTTRIVTGDKDLMQLVSNCCFLYDGMKEKEIHEPEVLEKFGVKPHQVVDVQALMGDSTDNVPGVPGIGSKTAAELINQFGSIDKLYANLDHVKNDRRRELLRDNRDKAYISRQLVSLKTDVQLPEISNTPFHLDISRAIEFARDELQSQVMVSKIAKLFKYQKDDTPAPPVNSERPKNYKLITTESELEKFLGGIIDTLAIDTETTGLNQMAARIVGISLAVSPNHGVYIPLRHEDKHSKDLFGGVKDSHPTLSIDTVKQKLWPVLKNESIVKVGHNLKYDMHILENEGWNTNEITPIDDTMLLSYILNGTAHRHGLDELAHLYLGHETIKFESLFPPKTKDADKNFAQLDPMVAAEYATEDAFVTFALYKLFRPKLDADPVLAKLYENCDRPLPGILLRMERAGVLVDQAKLAHLSEILHEKADSLAKEIWHLAKYEFNIGSPQQLSHVLFDKLGIVPLNKTHSTDAATLGELADKHPIISKILEWRSMTKLAGTYADALPRQIAIDGRIHTNYLQTSTNTARLSSRDPNLQNIPIKTEIGSEIRKAFIAPADRVLIDMDYSQIQLRLLAHIADVAELKETLAHGRDIHEATARKIFGVETEHLVTAAQRRAAKTVNFSIIYGISPFGLAAQLDIPRDQAKILIDSYMANFPEIRQYFEKTRDFVTANGYVMTPWGRRIKIPEIRNPQMKTYALRAAINAPIQGFEADLMRFAMVKIDRQISAHSDEIKMIMQVHDEIMFECIEAKAEYWAKIIKSEMESVAKLTVPLVADYSIGKSWEK
ncbi:MAG: DNA polymerase I [Alphaproteobacteria bacterium]|nr:DNA polymerase I [Alphaproteobacteria bacterium]